MEIVFFVLLLLLAPLVYFLLIGSGRRGDAARLHASSAARAPGGPGRSAEAVRVLVAEDNTVSARILDAFLSRMGCRATLTADGKEALRVASAQNYSMAIVDLSMPEMDGFDFALQYRRQEEDADHLPIIALTADATERVSDRCLSAGMDAILSKPIMYDQLADIVERYAGRSSEPA